MQTFNYAHLATINELNHLFSLKNICKNLLIVTAYITKLSNIIIFLFTHPSTILSILF